MTTEEAVYVLNNGHHLCILPHTPKTLFLPVVVTKLRKSSFAPSPCDSESRNDSSHIRVWLLREPGLPGLCVLLDLCITTSRNDIAIMLHERTDLRCEWGTRSAIMKRLHLKYDWTYFCSTEWSDLLKYFVLKVILTFIIGVKSMNEWKNHCVQIKINSVKMSRSTALTLTRNFLNR